MTSTIVECQKIHYGESGVLFHMVASAPISNLPKNLHYLLFIFFLN